MKATTAVARVIYDKRLECVRLRAMRATERSSATPRDQFIDSLGFDLARAEEELQALGRGPAETLADRIDLTPEVVDFLWTTVALSGDPRVQAHAQLMIGADAKRGATLPLHAVLHELSGDDGRALALVLKADHPLLKLHLLEVGEAAAPSSRVFHAPERLLWFLSGQDRLDPVVAASGAIVTRPAQMCWDAAQDEAIGRMARALLPVAPPVIILEGARGTGRRTALGLAADVLGKSAVAVDLRRVPASPDAVERTLKALRRECALRDALPIVADIEDLTDGENEGTRMRLLARLVDDTEGAFALVSSHVGLEVPLERRMLRVRFPSPKRETRQRLWEQALGPTPVADLEMLSMRYRLGAGGVQRAVSAATALASGRTLTSHDLVEGIRNDIAERLGGLAQRFEVKQTWDDLVLPSDTMDSIRAVIARVRHAHLVLDRWGFSSKLPSGLGVAGLFSGPPGTGKTMVAGLIARELDLELYQVDLSKVVSKWVGETEKQLGRIFDAAEAGHALLLFDEADSLFAKRTEVKAAIDRYANLEVNYLLQRIEQFGGITLLTTNMDTSIDPALRRRLAAHVVFWPPDREDRKTLWKRMLPAGAPVTGETDFDKLSDAFSEMTGAHIRNAVVAAAFLAASEGMEITQGHLLRAAKNEYRAMGRVL